MRITLTNKQTRYPHPQPKKETKQGKKKPHKPFEQVLKETMLKGMGS